MPQGNGRCPSKRPGGVVNNLDLLEQSVKAVNKCPMRRVLLHIIVSIFHARELNDKCMCNAALLFHVTRRGRSQQCDP